ncbi:PACE efflux transporter [Poseidonibacter lekithochrous]|uniref:PACE efflux transporter n=1 Tax=Poseidonibacter TaxID=2321187 RepID=UPI001C0A3F45|nr:MULTISPECIES: PACE efflux transporter [Poseidonibacter]MBU3015844.1 PACE efflux transporter [Poseidonibacter lekithochrous]MDO6829143.1 PACE efflux transporter [Poseidonibacter sp. 1_MG-2023]
MSFKERWIHAIIYEIMLIIIFTFVLQYITSHAMSRVLTLVILLSSIAVVWNFIFNWIFDKYAIGAREKRTFKTRFIHAILFEIGLILPTIPVIAYFLKIALLEAFIMDIGFIVFVLIFTIIYNYIYDRARLYFISIESLNK